MADIAADRAWMRNHAARQTAENDAANTQRWARERAESLSRCRFCFHARHHDYLVAASLDMTDGGGITYDAVTSDDWEMAMVVRPCQSSDCACGVDPCPGCGDRVSPVLVDDTLTPRCSKCGYGLLAAATA